MEKDKEQIEDVEEGFDAVRAIVEAAINDDPTGMFEAIDARLHEEAKLAIWGPDEIYDTIKAAGDAVKGQAKIPDGKGQNVNSLADFYDPDGDYARIAKAGRAGPGKAKLPDAKG